MIFVLGLFFFWGILFALWCIHLCLTQKLDEIRDALGLPGKFESQEEPGEGEAVSHEDEL